MKRTTALAMAVGCLAGLAGGAANAMSANYSLAEVMADGSVNWTRGSGFGEISRTYADGAGASAGFTGSPSPAARASAWLNGPRLEHGIDQIEARSDVWYDVVFALRSPGPGAQIVITDTSEPIGFIDGETNIRASDDFLGDATAEVFTDRADDSHTCENGFVDCRGPYTFTDMPVGWMYDDICTVRNPCYLADYDLVGRIYLTSEIELQRGRVDVAADPIVRINPGFFTANGLDPSQFELRLEPGIGNGLAAVPEPASWLSSIFGFMALGAVLRTRRRRLAGPDVA